jgi:hypothetical protein
MSKEDEFEKLKSLRSELDKILSGLSASGRRENTYSNVLIVGLGIVVPFNEKIEIQFTPLGDKNFVNLSLERFLADYEVKFLSTKDKNRANELLTQIRFLQRASAALQLLEDEYKTIRNGFVEVLYSIERDVTSRDWRDTRTDLVFTTGSIDFDSWYKSESHTTLVFNRLSEDIKIWTNLPSEGLKSLDWVLYNTYSRVYGATKVALLQEKWRNARDLFLEEVKALKEKKDRIAQDKAAQALAASMSIASISSSNSSSQKEENNMANENNSKSAATSTRRENGIGAREQASSFGKLMGTALQMAAVDQTGEVFLNMSKKFFGNNPSYEMLMESPQGREAMKLVTASVVRTILLSAPEAVKGSDGIVTCADLQVTFSGAKLMGALMTDLGDQLAILSNLGSGLSKE